MINIGSKVKVIDNKHYYPSYPSWIDKNAPQHKHMWSFFEKPLNGQSYTVVASGKHSDENKILYLISDGEQVYIIGEEGVEETMGFTKDDIKENMLVQFKNGEWGIIRGKYQGHKWSAVVITGNSAGRYVGYDDTNTDLTVKWKPDYEIVKVATYDYPGDIVRIIKGIREPEDIPSFKIIWQRENPKLKQLKDKAEVLRKTMDKAKNELEEIQDEIRRMA